MTAPERSMAQRRAALESANRVRTFRAQMKAAIKAGEQDALAVLVSPPSEAQTMKVAALLLAKPKLGEVKVNTILRKCHISPSKTISGLSERQRRELVERLR